MNVLSETLKETDIIPLLRNVAISVFPSSFFQNKESEFELKKHIEHFKAQLFHLTSVNEERKNSAVYLQTVIRDSLELVIKRLDNEIEKRNESEQISLNLESKVNQIQVEYDEKMAILSEAEDDYRNLALFCLISVPVFCILTLLLFFFPLL